MSVDRLSPPKRAAVVREFIKASSIVYVIMAVVGFEICWWYHQNAISLLGPIDYGLGMALGIVCAAVVFLYT